MKDKKIVLEIVNTVTQIVLAIVAIITLFKN
nr:MAG TPA: hypothetical protein [Caudoviricetes sp.]